MAKSEQEIHETDTIKWAPVAGSQGVFEKVLNVDQETGSVTRFLKYEPGARTTEVLVHDFVEEILVVEGAFVDTRSNATFEKGYYGYRLPGMVHGPYYSEGGMMTFEIRNYEKR